MGIKMIITAVVQFFRYLLKTVQRDQVDHVERKVPKYKNQKLWERKVKTLTRNWRDHWRTGTHKQTETVSRYFDRHGRLYQSEEGLIKTAVPVEISLYSFCVFACACPSVTSSISDKRDQVVTYIMLLITMKSFWCLLQNI